MTPSSTDPRAPFAVGIIILGILLLGGIIWAVVSGPSSSGGAYSDPNLSFQDDNDPSLGPADAKVTVRIFGDLQCPACKSAESGVTHIRNTYADQVRIVWNDFPLPPSVHPRARIAANAARCSEEQGKFWEMHDALYSAQNTWATASDPTAEFIKLAAKIGLDAEGFRSCLSDQRHDSKVSADMSEGNANGVDSTPTFFVNNTRYVGVLSAGQWDAILKPLLAASATPTPTETASSTSSTQ